MIEVLRELFRVTEMRDGAIYRTEYVRDVWIRPEEQPPPGYLHASKSDPDVVTIRRTGVVVEREI